MNGATGALIEVEHVSKWFGDVVAVSDVSFEVTRGITALLGPNGAGKSTVLRLLCGLARPSQGDVRVLGGDPRADISLLGRIGLAPQQEGMFETFTPREFVQAAAVLLRVQRPDEVTDTMLATVGLDPADPRPVRALSKGNRQRVKLAAALVHDPEIVLLDEPLTGLDPRQRLHVIDLMKRLGEEGRCVIVSSHVLEEVERFGSRVLVIAQGRLAAEGDFRAIRDLMDDRPHRLRVDSPTARLLAAALVESGVALGVHLESETRLVVETDDVARFRRSVARVARDRACTIDELLPLDDDLDSVFRYLVGR